LYASLDTLATKQLRLEWAAEEAEKSQLDEATQSYHTSVIHIFGSISREESEAILLSEARGNELGLCVRFFEVFSILLMYVPLANRYLIRDSKHNPGSLVFSMLDDTQEVHHYQFPLRDGVFYDTQKHPFNTVGKIVEFYLHNQVRSVQPCWKATNFSRWLVGGTGVDTEAASGAAACGQQ
jgi:hypothetical protein